MLIHKAKCTDYLEPTNTFLRHLSFSLAILILIFSNNDKVKLRFRNRREIVYVLTAMVSRTGLLVMYGNVPWCYYTEQKTRTGDRGAMRSNAPLRSSRRRIGNHALNLSVTNITIKSQRRGGYLLHVPGPHSLSFILSFLCPPFFTGKEITFKLRSHNQTTAETTAQNKFSAF